MSESQDTASEFNLSPSSDDEDKRKAKRAAYNKAYREANRPRIKAKQRAWNEANRERRVAQGEVYRAARKAHRAALNKARYEAKKEAINARNKAWREVNRETIAAQKKAYREANPELIEAQKHAKRCRQYGLTTGEYAAMLADCNGRCPCCGTPFSDILKTRPHIDHSHKLGHVREAVRGIICMRCNFLLGHAEDDPKILRACIRYLNSHK